MRARKSLLCSMTSNANRSFQLLQIAPRWPWPLDTGAKLRNFHLARSLSPQARVALAAFGGELRVDEPAQPYQPAVSVPREGHNSFGKLIRGAVGKTPLPLLNYRSEKMARAVQELIGAYDFDIVQFESIHLMPYLPIVRAARKPMLAVLDWHNIESALLEQYSDRQSNPLRRTYARRTAKLMRRMEARAAREFDAHIVCSDEDARRLGALHPDVRIFVIENGVDVARFTEARCASAARHRIVFVASMDYHANIDAAVWFAQMIWPRLRQAQPNLTFTIVGRDPAPEVRKLTAIPGVEVTGTVPDVRPFYREAFAAIAPLRVGSGSRLKILEAMAAGVPVVATSCGAEGLAVQPGDNVLIGDSAEALCEAIVSLTRNQEMGARLIESGRALVKAHYDWSTIGTRLLEDYQLLLSRSRPV